MQKTATNTHQLVGDNIREWIVALIVLNPDSNYYGGFFRARMSFKEDYPFSPPGKHFPFSTNQAYIPTPYTTDTTSNSDFKFIRPLYHPNVYPDGRLCISILHPPGDDEVSGELASERWSPVQSVESVLISVLSLLDDAEINSPANVDASKDYRDDKVKFKAMVQKDLEASKKDIPKDFEMPTHEDAFRQKKEEEYLMSWEDSDAGEDFEGSDWEMGDDDDEDDDTGSDAEEEAAEGEKEDE